MIRYGSAHSRAAIKDSRQASAPRTSRRPSRAAPAAASSTEGIPRYHSTQLKLDFVVLPAPVYRQLFKPLQRPATIYLITAGSVCPRTVWR